MNKTNNHYRNIHRRMNQAIVVYKRLSSHTIFLKDLSFSKVSVMLRCRYLINNTLRRKDKPTELFLFPYFLFAFSYFLTVAQINFGY